MKNMFLKSILKAAVAILPLAGLVSSCDLFTNNGASTEQEPAKAVINVKVVDRATGADLSSSATITASCSATVSVAGPVVTITGNKSIAAQSVTINASTSAGTGSTTIQIPALNPTWSYVGNATIFVGSWPNVPPTPAVKEEAEAEINVSVIDLSQNEKDVTADATITATSTGSEALAVANNIVTITGNKAIAAQTVTVKAAYNELTGEETIDIPAVAEGEFYGCGLFIPVGKSTPVPPGEDKAAVATIKVKVLDRSAENADVTEASTIAATSSDAACKIAVDKNVITVTGDLAIAAQDITINVTYGELKATDTFALKEVAANKTYKASKTIYVGESPYVPGEGSIEEFKIAEVYTYGEMIFLPNATLQHKSLAQHASHNGHGVMLNWMENDSEYIFTDWETYPVYTGSYVWKFNEITDPTVKEIASAFNGGIKSSTAQYYVKASAWSIWTLFAQVETVTTTYEVRDIKADGSYTVLGMFDVISKNVVVTYEEQAHPGHAAAYHKGEGHGSHGDSNNAGGGIIIAD